MIAALLTEINQPLELTEVQPDMVAAGQVLVRVLVSGICGAQLSEIRGEKGTHFPRLMGHEGCGIVEEIHHAGSTKFKVGDKVVMHWRKGSGAESRPPEYVLNGKVITSGQVTTFSEFSICSENRLTPVPPETPNELCALLGCGLSTALGVMENEARLKAGESVLIVGCGGVGLNLIRVSRMMGASHITGMDSSSKCEGVIAAGAHGFTMPHYEWRRMPPWDVIVDTTGNVDAIESVLPLLAPSGRFIMVGQPRLKDDLILYGARHLFDGEGKTIKATQGGGFNPDRDLPRYLAMWKSGHLKIDGIITHRYPFLKINEALDAVRSGSAGRAMIEMV